MITELDTLNDNQLEEKSNFQLFGIGKPSAKQLARRKKKDVTQQITGCVKPQQINQTIGVLTGNLGMAVRYNKQLKEYKACLNNYKAKSQAEADAKIKAQEEARIAQEKLDAVIAQQNNLPTSTEADTEKNITEDDKILGMPKPVFWVGVGVLTLVAGFVTYKLVTRNKGK